MTHLCFYLPGTTRFLRARLAVNNWSQVQIQKKEIYVFSKVIVEMVIEIDSYLENPMICVVSPSFSRRVTYDLGGNELQRVCKSRSQRAASQLRSRKI